MDSASGNGVGLVLDGRYQLVRELASGTSGAVFEGRDKTTRGRVAVKLLHADLLGSDQHVKRFLREMRAAERIDHPGVVRFLGSGQAPDGRPFLVQELLDGEDLREVMNRGGLNLPDVFEIGIQVLDALGAVHASGLVHRDVKPENLLISHDEFGSLRVKIVDFGIAKRKKRQKRKSDPRELTETTQLTEIGTIVGTPHYMSPEQARAAEIDARSDLWSVGVVLFQALTDALPFDGSSPLVILATIVGAPAPSLADLEPGLPAWLHTVVDRALQKDVARRWQTATEMANAMREGIGG